MSSRDIPQLGEGTKEIWDKMWIFKQRYKEYSNKVRTLEDDLAVVNLELSLTKAQNTLLQDELKVKESSITKYQKILKELVDVEDKYCKLLAEKKKSDEELAVEKKLRLELELRFETEKSEVQNSLQDELRILKDHAAEEDKIAAGENSKIIEDQKKQIQDLKRNMSESVQQYEDLLQKMKQDLRNAQREIFHLKCATSTGVERTKGANHESLNKIITRSQICQSDVSGGQEESHRNKPILTNGRLKDESSYATENLEQDCNFTSTPSRSAPSLSISRRSRVPPDPVPASRFYPIEQCTPRHWPLSASSALSDSVRTVEVDSQLSTAGKHEVKPLEVFRLPTRNKKSPVKRKRKLYSRSDDTL